MFQYDYTPAKLYDCGGKMVLDNGSLARWYAYYSVRINGKLKLKKLKAGINRGKTIAERRRIGTMVVSKLNNLLEGGWRPGGTPEYKPIVPLKDVLTQLLEIKKATLRRRTWQSYKYAMDAFIKWMKHANAEYIFPDQFTNVMAHSFSDYLQRDRNLGGKGFNSTKNNVNILMNMMVQRELIKTNPLSKIKNLPEEVGKNIAFSELQRNQLTGKIKEENYRLYLFTQFVYFCYIRPLELLRLKVSNVDMQKKVITIYGNQSKNKKTESIVIPDAFFPEVEAMELNKFPEEYFLFGKGFLTSETDLGRNSVTKHHKTFLTKLEFSDQYTLYSHKHSGVVSAYNQGIDIYSIMRQCRHGSITETQRYLKSLGLMPNIEFASKMK